MKIVTILREGTTRSYSHLAYSRDGRLLVSQGGDPDYMITVWNWKKSKILLHCKSHGQEIYNVMFSPTVLGHLTTSGAGHIKFWKIARTFTGLKLQGELGRFGKTEISDIIGVYPMPDEKVVSGCEWGNILIWDEDLIKLQVWKKSRKPCHGKFITQFEYLNGDLVSIGMDGWIRVWYYETIDQADPPDEDRFLENEPIYEVQIKEKDSSTEDDASSMLVSIKKKNPNDSEENLWYAQDGNGGLWLVELGIYEQPKQDPQKLLTCHAGPILWMDVSTWGPFVATCGRDGHLHIFNYSTKRLILVKKFRDKGTSRVVWFPCSIESTGSTLACAFESGVVRIVTLAILQADQSNNINGDYSRLIQAIKPHKSAITAMSLNPNNSLLVTGSEDSTIFVFSLKVTETYPKLVPIGYVKLFSGVSCITWKPEQQRQQQPNTILIGCLHGDCAEIQLPDKPQNYTKVTYELVQCESKYFKFQSVKSKIRRELARLEIEKIKANKRCAKRERMEQLQMDNPGIEIDEDEFFIDVDEDPPLPEIHIPEVQNRVLMANYTAAGTIWLTMGGYDAGYIYEYPIPTLVTTTNDVPTMEPIKSTIVTDADDTEITSCFFYKNKYLFLGMQRGEIRICRINPQDDTDLSDYLALPMHDNKNGFIPVISLSYDEKNLLTCGHDGNLFSYNINDESTGSAIRIEKPQAPRQLPSLDVEDIEESAEHLILEEVIVKSEHDLIVAAAKRKKDAILSLLGNLTEEYRKIVERNSRILKSQQIPQEEFEIDPRITADLNNHLKGEMDLVYKKLAFEVEKSRLGLQKLLDHFIEPIAYLPFAVRRISKPRRRTMVRSLRERKLGPDFSTIYSDVVTHIEEKSQASRIFDIKILETVEEEEDKKNVQTVESFLMGLDRDTVLHRLGIQMNQLLRKYRAREEKMKEREMEWKIMYASKPDPNSNHPDDVAAIKKAKNTIGDYKLKVFPDYSQSQEQERETTFTKYKQLLDCRKKTHHIREDFNSRLRGIRDKKLALQYQVLASIEKLKEIHAEIPDKKIKPLPVVPEIEDNIELPEKNLELEKYVTMAERVKATKRKKMSISEEIIINPMDEEYEVLLLDQRVIGSELDASIKNLEVVKPEKLSRARVSVAREILKSLEANDRRETSWEREMKRLRVTRKVYEQDSILSRIEKSYENLDHELDELELERLAITADSIYSDLFLLTLHQELIILKDFESMENILTDKVAEKMKECDRINCKIQSTTTKIDQSYKEITKLHDKIKDVQYQFNRMVSDNKFADFLRRIYKKKFKPPKDVDDESSSSSSSDTSTEDDDKSIASDDLGPLHLNESICPIGCDQELYNSTFSMRDERYECEHKIRDAQKIIEFFCKEVDGESKKLKQVDSELKSNQKDLKDFMCEKQRKLNDIDMTVILKFHQLQHFVGENEVAKIRDCVIFDRTKLSRLYTRVGELQQETLDQKEKHKKNRTHLHRMKIDCKHMEAEIKSLKNKIKQEMIQKFGREVSLDNLYEAVLKRMIYDVKADVKEMTKDFDRKIESVKEKYYEQLSVLESLVRDNTEKLSFLTVLEGEHMKLKKILRHKPESEENIFKMEAEYKEDLDRLESIIKNQRNQKKLFENDIKNLRLKSRPLPPICAERRANLYRKVVKSGDERNVTSLDPDCRSEKEFATEATCQNSEKIDDKIDSDNRLKIIFNEEKKDENDSRTAAMVHRLLSRVLKGSAEDHEREEGASREILKKVLEKVRIGGEIAEMREGIERSVDQIIKYLPQKDDEMMEAMREAIRESLHEIVQRFEEESREIGTSFSEIGWNMKQKITDLLESIGINRDTKIENSLIKCLKSVDGIETAIDYLSKNVKTVLDVETLTALKEHAFRTLTEIKEEMENSNEQTSPLQE